MQYETTIKKAAMTRNCIALVKDFQEQQQQPKSSIRASQVQVS
jgi:hypothetical protein